MKIGDLYYGVTIPESELKKLEAQLRRFEQSIQVGKGPAKSVQDTTRAVKASTDALRIYQVAWTDLQQVWVANEMSVRDYLDEADDLQQALKAEMKEVEYGSAAWTKLANTRKAVTRSITTETEALTNAERKTGQSMAHLTRENLKYLDSAQTLVTRIKNLKSELSALNYAWDTGQMKLPEVLAGMERLQKTIAKEITLVNKSRLSIDDRNRALETLYGMGRRVQSSIDTTALAVRGVNRHTAEGINLTDSLTKAWLIGLGPQGYRLYLVMDVLKQTFDGFNKTMKVSISLAAKFGQVAVALVAVAGMITAGAIIAGLSQMLSIEDAMADVRKTTNLTVVEIDGLISAFQHLSTRLPSTVVELAEIATAAGQLGIRGQKNIYEFTEAVAEMALVMNDLGDDPAVMLGKFLNVIGTPISEFGTKAKEVAGILNELENNTAATAGEVLEMSKSLAQLSSVAGVSMRDILALGAGLKSMGIEAELAGTNTTKIFMDLVRNVALGTSEVDKWARAADMTKESFIELARSENGFSEAIKRVAINLGRANLTAEEMTLTLDALGFTNSRERRIITNLAQGYLQFARAVDVANDESGTASSIQRELAARLDVTKVQFQLLRNRIAAVTQVIGAMLLPYIKSMVVWMNENTEQIAAFGAGIGTVIDGAIVLAHRLNALRWAVVAFGEAAITPFVGMGVALSELTQKITAFLTAFQISYDMFIRMGSNPMTAMVNAFETLRTMTPELLDFTIDWENATARQGVQAGRVADAWSRSVQAMQKATELSENMALNFSERKAQMMFDLPTLTDSIDVAQAIEAALLDLDLDFDEDGKAVRSIADVRNELTALLAGIDRQAEVMEARGREYDAFAAKHDAITAAINELVFTFGQGAKSADVQEFLAMLVELGVDAQLAAEELAKVVAAKHKVDEALTEKYVGLDSYRLEFGDMGRSEIQESFQRLQGDAARLRGDLADAFAAGDWPAFASIETRLRSVMGVIEEFRAEILSWEGTMQGLAPDARGARESEDAGTIGRGAFLNAQGAKDQAAWLEDQAKAAALTRAEWERLMEAQRDTLEMRFSGDNAMLYTLQALRQSGMSFGEALEYLENAGVKVDEKFTNLVRSAYGLGKAIDETGRTGVRVASIFASMPDEGLFPDTTSGSEMFHALRNAGEELRRELSLIAAAFADDPLAASNASIKAQEEYVGKLATIWGSEFHPRVLAAKEVLAGLRAENELLVRQMEMGEARVRSFFEAMPDEDAFPDTSAGTEFFDSLRESAAALALQMGRIDRALADGVVTPMEAVNARIEAQKARVQELTQIYKNEFHPAVLAAKKALAGLEGELASMEALEDLRKELEGFQSNGKNPYTKLIEGAEALQAETEEVNEELAEMLRLLKILSKEWEQVAALEEFTDKLDFALTAMRNMFDLTQDNNWTNGNKWIESFYEIGAAAVSLIPVVGPALGKIVSMVGEFVNAVIGDLSNGLAEVEQQILDTAKSSERLGEGIVRALTVTEQVSRGGLAGFLGFTKTVVDELATEMNIALAESFASGMYDAVKAAISGDKNWKKDLRESIRETVVNALINAFIESTILQAGMEEFINEFNALLQDGDVAGATAFAASFVDTLARTLGVGVEAITAALEEASLDFGEALGSGLKDSLNSAMSEAAKAIATGSADWKENLEQSIRESVANAIIQGFIAAQVTKHLDRIIDVFDSLMETDPGKAAEFMAFYLESILQQVGASAEIIAEALEGILGPIADAGEEIGDTLVDSINQSLSGALSGGIMDSLTNTNWVDDLGKNIKEVVAGALIDAFVEAMMVQSTIADFIGEFARLLNEESREAALEFARGNIDSIIGSMTGDLELIRELLLGAGLLVEDFPDPPDPKDYSGDFSPASSFSLPTASASLISATPAWIDNLGAYFDKFGSYVDRLVDEGITVNVSTTQASTTSGVTAQDLRLIG